jgi:hypothetical protein
VASDCNELKRWANCILEKRMNIKVDSLAKKTLICTHATNDYFNGIFPEEDFCIFVSDTKVTGPIKSALKNTEEETLQGNFLTGNGSFLPLNSIASGGKA